MIIWLHLFQRKEMLPIFYIKWSLHVFLKNVGSYDNKIVFISYMCVIVERPSVTQNRLLLMY